ncbi:MAG: hypothetical protein AAF985_22895 [Bacteroidota bacterium]
MYKLLTKHGQMIAFGLGVLITAIFLISVFSGLEEFNGLGKEQQYETTIFNFGITAVRFLVVATFVIMIVFGLYHVLTNLKGSMKGILGFVVLLAIFGISYATATSETSDNFVKLFEKFDVTDGASKFITAAINTGLALCAIAGVSFVISEVRNFFK